MDKRIYNEKVFSYKKNTFNGTKDKKILVIGNSFARDFINVTLETYDTTNVEIIYRDDLRPCIAPYRNTLAEILFQAADIIVFASGFDKACIKPDLNYASKNEKTIFYAGTKDFGYNLNWIIRLQQEERRNKYNKIPKWVISLDREMASAIPKDNYISLLGPTLVDESIPITDDLGRMLSTDRAHLTKYGAIYFGQTAVKNTAYSDLFK